MPDQTASPPPPSRPRSAANTTRLTREDWLDAAFAAVVEAGFDQARVLLLAERLGVTRGSFYWHFKDHATLIEALVERWEARELEAHQRLEQAGSEDPAKALEIMLDQALAHGGDALDDMRFELALRALGRRDAHVAAVMRKMDALRIALFKRKFMPLVQDEKTAAELATLFYLSVVGSFHALIQPHMPSASKQFFLDIIAKYLVQKQRR